MKIFDFLYQRILTETLTAFFIDVTLTFLKKLNDVSAFRFPL